MKLLMHSRIENLTAVKKRPIIWNMMQCILYDRLRTKFLPPFSGWSYEITTKMEAKNPTDFDA